MNISKYSAGTVANFTQGFESPGVRPEVAHIGVVVAPLGVFLFLFKHSYQSLHKEIRLAPLIDWHMVEAFERDGAAHRVVNKGPGAAHAG